MWQCTFHATINLFDSLQYETITDTSQRSITTDITPPCIPLLHDYKVYFLFLTYHREVHFP